jgi:protein-L-isoaspartate(D-aspartate) O-methyltransferase
LDFVSARRNMIDCQILPNRITDERILDVMLGLPREEFLPKSKHGVAYVDRPLSLGHGRYLLEPLTTARMLQALELRSTDVALAIGCGSGYSVAVLAKIVDTVVALESHKLLSEEALKTFSSNNIDNLVLVDGVLSEGYPKQAPYDVIFFDGSVTEVPPQIKNQLSNRGRAVAILMKPGEIGVLKLYKKFHGVVSSIDLFEVNTPLLPGFEMTSTFSF